MKCTVKFKRSRYSITVLLLCIVLLFTKNGNILTVFVSVVYHWLVLSKCQFKCIRYSLTVLLLYYCVFLILFTKKRNILHDFWRAAFPKLVFFKRLLKLKRCTLCVHAMWHSTAKLKVPFKDFLDTLLDVPVS